MLEQARDKHFDIESFLKSLTSHPGVYRMLDANDKVLYVGKAKNLKNRVSSYFKGSGLSIKTQALVKKIRRIEVTVTLSETEALLLEQTLIKALKPPYNILLRDDKSYPYLFLSDQEYPRLAYHRGSKKAKGDYFGPYPSAAAVRETLAILQKLFKVRQCEDSFFRNRSRPCLQYQIGRCTAPCVKAVSKEDYAQDVRHTAMFLNGKSNDVAQELAQKMEAASDLLEFEKAALYRDQIAAIRRVQEQQYVMGEGGDVDIIGLALQAGVACIQVVHVRGGRVIGNQNYFQNTHGEDSQSIVLDEFLPQYYLGTRNGRDLPDEIILPESTEYSHLLADALEQSEGRKVRILSNVRSQRAGWQSLANTNAQQNLASYLTDRAQMFQRFVALQELLKLEFVPERLECFDISHTQGEGTVASCVVFDQKGPKKSDYRRFNIENIQAGDDYAAMEQALRRRYMRLKKGEGKLPDILIIDGGKGQLSQASAVLNELQIQGVILLGVAKGTTRKPGLETLFMEGDSVGFSPESDNPGLHLIQHIRDESHRFAISGHRARRGKKRTKSVLEAIPGVGPARRKQLLAHFGGLQELKRASCEEIGKVKGISKKMAEEIYAALHGH